MKRSELKQMIREVLRESVDKDLEIRKLQTNIKRLLNKELSMLFTAGERYKAEPTIVRGKSGATKREWSYFGEFSIDTPKGAWNAINIDFHKRKSPKLPSNVSEFEEFVKPLEDLLNQKYNVNEKWFSRKEYEQAKKYIIEESNLIRIFKLND